ncbi:cytochrome c [Urbifossiella limnaea]|uniref:Cytochrome c n=1 Tax=Urbifossiella limnaea TaxID=2528023 RepID=A0A517XNW4_9BACT|nr:cytochrome c [Urbifossiella limnaea]QDU19199.1 hypothetical protein ETAA1_11030 [Urbifossiella limnaea]
MTNTFVRVGFTAAVAAALFVAVGTPTVAQEKGLTIKDIMKAGHGGTDPLLKQVIFAAKDGKWDAAVAAAKSLDSNAALLHKATPSKGGADSWEKLGGAYHKNTSALLAAAEKKNADGVKTSAGAIQGSCKACHTAHKGK